MQAKLARQDGVGTATSHNPNRALLAICLADLGAMSGFYLLFPVVPLHAAAAAGAGAAGLVTGALMLATVVAELAMPSLAARFGYRQLFCAGLLLLGLPALVLAASANLLAILAVSALRGVGLGILLVAGSSLVAAIMPAGRRAEGFGIYGVASGVPAIVALPLGPWLAAHFGTAPVFVCGGLAALCGLAAMIELPRNTPRPAAAIGILAGLAMPALMRPALALVFVAMAAGIVTTFLPLMLLSTSGDLIALVLLAHAAMSTLARWLAGRYGGSLGEQNLLVAGMVAAALGIIALVCSEGAVVLTIGMLLVGAGFGMVQNASLSLMFERVPASGYDMVSAIWNLAYDAGLGLGAVAFGVLAAGTGYGMALAVVAAVMVGAVVYVRRG